MKTPASNIYTISQWLDIATKQLAPSAKERIASEIETHYADALETHLAENQNPTDASINALKELGDPHEAAEVYGKKYLTLNEDKEIRKLLSQPSKYHWLTGPAVCSLIWLLAVFCFDWSPGSYALSILLVVLVCLILIPLHSRRLFKMLPDRRAAKGLMLIEALEAVVWLAFTWALPATWVRPLLLFQPAFHAYRWLHIRSKFSKSSAPVQPSH